jgi:hypothetical protein
MTVGALGTNRWGMALRVTSNAAGDVEDAGTWAATTP